MASERAQLDCMPNQNDCAGVLKPVSISQTRFVNCIKNVRLLPVPQNLGIFHEDNLTPDGD